MSIKAADNLFNKLYILIWNNISTKAGLLKALSVILLSITIASCYRSTSPDRRVSTNVDYLNHQADSLQHNGDYIHALDTLLKAYRIIDSNPEVADSIRLRTYFLLGRTYSIYDDYVAASRYYNMVLALKDKVSDTGTLLKTFNNLFAAYTDMRRFEEADSINEAIRSMTTHDTITRTFHYLFNRGFLSSRKSEWDKAVTEFQKTLDFLAGNEQLSELKAYPYSEIGHIYSITGHRDSAYKYLKLFETQSELSEQPYVKVSALREMMLWAAKYGNAAMASDYLDQYFTYTDSLINLQSFLRAKENIRQYEDESSRIKIDDMSDRLSSRHRWIINLSLLLLIAMMVCAVVVWRNRSIRKANRILYEKNNELTTIETLYRELLLEQSEQRPEPSDESAPDSTGNPATAGLLEKILREMEENRPYLDADYSLQSLASSVGSNTKYVSQVINDELGKNFRGFINEYRVSS